MPKTSNKTVACLLCLLATCLAWAGCAGKGVALLDARRTFKRTVAEVIVVGNENIPASKILRGLGTRPPSGWIWVQRAEYDPVILEADRKRIESFYARQGFFSARVVDTDVQAVRVGKFSVRIVIDEGEPSRIASILITGTERLAEDERRALDEQLDLAPGDVFVHERYQHAKKRLEQKLANRGFAHARVGGRVEVDREQRSVRIEFQVDAGPRVRFGSTSISGLERLPESSVRTRIAWEENETFDPARIELTRKRLFLLGHFNSIRFDYPTEDRPDVADMHLVLGEGTSHEIKLGVGTGIDRAQYQFRARVDYSLRGFLHPLTTLRVNLRPAYMFLPDVTDGSDQNGFGGEAIIGVDQEDFHAPRLRVGLDLGYTVSGTQVYRLHGLRCRLSADRPLLDDRLIASLGYQFRIQSFLSANEALDLDDIYRLAFLDQGLVYDGRDNPLDTRSGFYAALRLEEGSTYVGGAFDYVRATPEARGYLPLGSRVVLAARLRLGAVIHADGQIPITQRYYAGGASSQRGFSQQRLSPFKEDDDDNTVPVGGNVLFESSFEVRFDALRLFNSWLSIVGFVDGADVVEDVESLDLTHLHWAAGAGMRYLTPIGPIRFDLGIRLNRKGEGEPDPDTGFAFHFSLGEAF